MWRELISKQLKTPLILNATKNVHVYWWFFYELGWINTLASCLDEDLQGGLTESHPQHIVR